MTLQELINHRNITQADLARRLGIAKQNLNAYVKGRRKPKMEFAAKVAKELNATVRLAPGLEIIDWDYFPIENYPEQYDC